LGYVGLTTAVVLAYHGYDVIGVDIDPRRVEMVRRGRAPIYEPGLEEMLRTSVESGRLTATTSYEELADADIVFITVGTPSLSDGSINLSYVHHAAKRLGGVLVSKKGGYPVIAVKSTVTPGTARRVARIIEEASGLRLGSGFGVVSNPEFLREGRAVEDTLRPSRLVIGEVDKKGASILEEFWTRFYGMLGHMPPVLRVTAETAEMIKYASNAFLAMKISFANTLARICEKIPGCDIVEVVRGMGLDPRINPAFLGAGLGYGGSCFPKDVKALVVFAKQLCVDAQLLEVIDRVNETQPLHVAKRLEEILGGLENKTIVILGAAFKPDTDDVRESRAIVLARLLLERGAHVRLHDPNPAALENAKKILGSMVGYYSNVEEALKNADAVVIATEWSDYRSLTPETFTRYMKRPVILDARRIYDPQRFVEAGVEFYAVGLGASHGD